jgi:hypothetical protein
VEKEVAEAAGTLSSCRDDSAPTPRLRFARAARVHKPRAPLLATTHAHSLNHRRTSTSLLSLSLRVLRQRISISSSSNISKAAGKRKEPAAQNTIMPGKDGGKAKPLKAVRACARALALHKPCAAAPEEQSEIERERAISLSSNRTAQTAPLSRPPPTLSPPLPSPKTRHTGQEGRQGLRRVGPRVPGQEEGGEGALRKSAGSPAKRRPRRPSTLTHPPPTHPNPHRKSAPSRLCARRRPRAPSAARA